MTTTLGWYTLAGCSTTTPGWYAMAFHLIEVLLREVSYQVDLIGRKIEFATKTHQEMLSFFATRRWLKQHDKTCVWTIINMIIVMYWLVFTRTLSTQTTLSKMSLDNTCWYLHHVLTLHGDTPYDMNNHAFGLQQSLTWNIVNALIAHPVVN
jgi:hypothetical protein